VPCSGVGTQRTATSACARPLPRPGLRHPAASPDRPGRAFPRWCSRVAVHVDDPTPAQACTPLAPGTPCSHKGVSADGVGHQHQPRSVPLWGDGAGGQPLPQLQCCPVVAAVHSERAFPHPGAGREPDPGKQQAGTAAAEAQTPRAHAERVRGAQGGVVAGQGLVEVDGHRPRRGDLPVGRGARKRFLRPPTRPRTHARTIVLH
jgi:hypothetical protein